MCITLHNEKGEQEERTVICPLITDIDAEYFWSSRPTINDRDDIDDREHVKKAWDQGTGAPENMAVRTQSHEVLFFSDKGLCDAPDRKLQTAKPGK